jgi:predicted RNase H-like nuclease
MEQLNDKITETYCEVCACNIKNKQKHIITKKHQKELSKTNKVFNEAVCLSKLYIDFDVNNPEQRNNLFNALTEMMKN